MLTSQKLWIKQRIERHRKIVRGSRGLNFPSPAPNRPLPKRFFSCSILWSYGFFTYQKIIYRPTYTISRTSHQKKSLLYQGQCPAVIASGIIWAWNSLFNFSGGKSLRYARIYKLRVLIHTLCSRLRCVTTPEEAQKVLLNRLGLNPPATASPNRQNIANVVKTFCKDRPWLYQKAL
jgi:hypothetical protein